MLNILQLNKGAEMTNKEWLDSLNEFDKIIVITNFVRNIPEHNQTNKEYIKQEFREWLKKERD